MTAGRAPPHIPRHFRRVKLERQKRGITTAKEWTTETDSVNTGLPRKLSWQGES